MTLSLVHPQLGWGTNFGQCVTGHTPGRIDRNGTVLGTLLKSRCGINKGSKKSGDFVANECWYNRCSYNYIWYLQPKITYSAEVWYIPPHIPSEKTKQTGSLTVLHKLQKIQRIAVLAIARAMRLTPSDTLHVQVGILPMELTLKKLCQRSVLWLSSLPNTNPAAYLVQDAQRYPDKYRTFATSIHIHHCLFSITHIR